MKALLLAAMAVISISACAPQGDDEHADLGQACTAAATTSWQGLEIEASTRGPDCARAAVTLVFRAANSGEIARMETHRAMDVAPLAAINDAAGMQAALSAWIDQTNPEFATSANLPDWQSNAETPMRGDFAFVPSEGTSREAYDVLRARSAPLFCYVRGLESINCLALVDGELDSIGVQTFPG
ncbi:hypothetical protein [Candidatus Viadribacter manganicus]|uniref:Lipoprotein n=1 Tax=Candidatus Viadribacter manganicus TaxID=1759059 RepID=A0A1B1AGI5_9PROT|nr:hypothetical protein [Candidatus Viadribacter manganicus]ANP45668.1 hypothetical protein ATE48_06905 [Candidatus Viadribacter manganicus]